MAGTFIFRADGNREIGTGHLMRCLCIASALRERNGTERLFFVCADEDSADFVRWRGFQVLLSGTDYRKMETELPFWEELMRKTAAPVCILADSYYVTEAYLAALRGYGRVVLLDDLGNRAFPADVLVNYHIYADTKVYAALYPDRQTRLCVGAEYAPLRGEFSGEPCRVGRTVREALITTGGADTDSIGETILRELAESCPGIVYHLVAGSFHPRLRELRQMEAERPDVVIEQDVKDMSVLMRKCDICVTAGGTTVYELASMGLPFICFSYAENQEALTEYIGEHGIAGYAGAWHRDGKGTLDEIRRQFARLAASETLREEYRRRERELTDGRGAHRIAGVMEDCIKREAGV